jgi:hypothetical protein
MKLCKKIQLQCLGYCTLKYDDFKCMKNFIASNHSCYIMDVLDENTDSDDTLMKGA